MMTARGRKVEEKMMEKEKWVGLTGAEAADEKESTREGSTTWSQHHKARTTYLLLIARTVVRKPFENRDA